MDKQLWTAHRVQWSFDGKLCGQTPKNVEMVNSWLMARRPEATPPQARSIPEIQAEVAASMANEETVEEVEQRSWLGFQAQNGQLVMRGATVRAHLKDCARIISKMYVGKVKGESTLGWKIVNGLYVKEYWVPILRDGIPVTVPDGYMDKAVHVQTRQGPMNALKRIDFLQGVTMTFTLQLLCGLKHSDIETIMQYGAIHGYAGERSEAEGRYVYEFEEEAVSV